MKKSILFNQTKNKIYILMNLKKSINILKQKKNWSLLKKGKLKKKINLKKNRTIPHLIKIV